MRYVIVGGGGHGKVISSVAHRRGWELVGVLDDGLKSGSSSFYGSPVLGATDSFHLVGADVGFCLGIGDNLIRTQIFERLKQAGRQVFTLSDPSALIDETCVLGEGTVVMPGVILSPGVNTGVNCVLNTGCHLDVDVRVGNGVHVAPGGKVGAQACIEDRVFVCTGAIVEANVRVGKDSIVAAGAVVCEDVPEGKVVMGAPARVTRSVV